MIRARQSPRLVGANIEHAGQHNQRVVLHAIRVNGPVTRADLADVTGLTPATVTNITNRLLESGLLDRAGQRRGGRGQPATRLVVNPNGAFSVGVNIDRDHLTMVAVDFGGAVRARIGREMAFPMPEDVRAFYTGEIDALLAQAGMPRSAVTGIGVALPDDLGAVDLPGRPADYERWSATRLEELFAAPLNVPILVENDAAAAAIGEMQFGLGQHYSSFFYLLATFGLGGGVVVHSLYDRGADGRSGEIGFMIVDDGRGGMTQLQNILSLAGLAREFDLAGLSGESVRAPDVTKAPVARVIQNWVERAAQALVQPMIAVNCLLNPEVVLVGGRLPIALIEQIAHRTNTLVRMHGRHAPAIAPIRAAALAEDAAAVGAALLPFGELLLPADAGALRRERTGDPIHHHAAI
ncbi:ROK family transcriptional regulator [Sphingomonas sp. SUN019]|uniref:ROK family transcriptional regulator n=1 Tax=Sphingomonas sp. SUN019 TaxID=2937788 RepID=UPI002164E56E|nr:ROK family transcriptional regulator [Sphingomonas sp. SUN019]UVO50560.1 ROK family transcriptional regulator [Sphingomonas sp. SUN019]